MIYTYKNKFGIANLRSEDAKATNLLAQSKIVRLYLQNLV